MRSILNTTLSWGLVRIPVKVYTATSTHDRDLHQYHRDDGGRIRYEKVCELDDEPVPSKEITKGVEDRDGNLVIIEDDELENPPVTSKVIETLTFVPNEQIDTIYYEKSYYLGPGEGGTEPYIVLRDALTEKDLSPSSRSRCDNANHWPRYGRMATFSCSRRCCGPTKSACRTPTCPRAPSTRPNSNSRSSSSTRKRTTGNPSGSTTSTNMPWRS
jgi:hypothetical protein